MSCRIGEACVLRVLCVNMQVLKTIDERISQYAQV